jgi:hypothetical protein
MTRKFAFMYYLIHFNKKEAGFFNNPMPLLIFL